MKVERDPSCAYMFLAIFLAAKVKIENRLLAMMWRKGQDAALRISKVMEGRKSL